MVSWGEKSERKKGEKSHKLSLKRKERRAKKEET
jgi:hypothetical protein